MENSYKQKSTVPVTHGEPKWWIKMYFYPEHSVNKDTTAQKPTVEHKLAYPLTILAVSTKYFDKLQRQNEDIKHIHKT